MRDSTVQQALICCLPLVYNSFIVIEIRPLEKGPIMQKRVAVLLFVVMLFLVPSVALGEEARSVSNLCLEASQAQTSEAMSQSIHDAFEAMKVEATACTRSRHASPTALQRQTCRQAIRTP